MKYISWSLLSLLAFLSDSSSSNLVQANFLKVGEGVVRVDLEKKYIPHLHDSLQLSDDVDVDKLMLVGENTGLETDLLIDSEETNYSLLREQNRQHLGKSIRQEHATSLA